MKILHYECKKITPPHNIPDKVWEVFKRMLDELQGYKFENSSNDTLNFYNMLTNYKYKMRKLDDNHLYSYENNNSYIYKGYLDDNGFCKVNIYEVINEEN